VRKELSAEFAEGILPSSWRGWAGRGWLFGGRPNGRSFRCLEEGDRSGKLSFSDELSVEVGNRWNSEGAEAGAKAYCGGGEGCVCTMCNRGGQRAVGGGGGAILPLVVVRVITTDKANGEGWWAAMAVLLTLWSGLGMWAGSWILLNRGTRTDVLFLLKRVL
jgi:hypothetical protein